MPILVEVEGRKFYACGECGLIYESLDIASKCEEWCRAHETCNVELERQAVGYMRAVKGLRM